MGKPIEHERTSVKLFGGKPGDYLKIHGKLDSSNKSFGDTRHRAMTHHQWFIEEVLIPLFGETIKNSDKKLVSVARIAECHIMEDFGGKLKKLPDGSWTLEGGYIPAPADYLAEIEPHNWMDNAKNGEVPPSRRKIKAQDDAGTKQPEKIRCPDCQSDNVARDPQHSNELICNNCGLVIGESEETKIKPRPAPRLRVFPEEFPRRRCGGGGMGGRMVLD